MSIFWHEIKSHWKGLLGWSAGVSFTIISGMAKFEGYSASGSGNVNQILQAFPKPLMAVFGIVGIDITRLIGYFGVLYLYIALVVAIHAGLLGADVIAEEERDKTSEFLYAKPITRTNALTQKLLAALVNILVVFGVSVATSILIVAFYNKGNSLNGQVLTLMWGILFFQLLSFAFGAFFAGIFNRPKLPSTAITVVILASYIFSVTTELSKSLEPLKYLTPFWYFGAPKILNDGHLDSLYVGLSSVLIVLLFVGTYVSYNRRDLTV